MENIYSKNVNVKKDIEPNLFEATWEAINNATDKGFAQGKYNTPNNEFITQVKHNNAVFAAFKTHRQQNDMANKLLDDKGNLKSFKQFKTDVTNIVGKYNSQWLKTEYDTAIIRARQAANFKRYEQEKDLYPNLKWLPYTSPNPREAHTHFYGTVLPMDDPFWQQHCPGNVWNCKCSVTSTDEKPTSSVPRAQYTPSEGLEGNPAFTGKMFGDNHPYIKNQYPGAKKAIDKALPGIFETAKTYKNGGMVEIHTKVNRKDNDYKDLYNISNLMAKAGDKVKILPKLHYKSQEYKMVYNELAGTKYERKCPDLKVNDEFFEYESYIRPFKKAKIKSMLNRGLKQSDNVIINNSKGAAHRLIMKNIYDRLHINQQISNVFLFENGNIIKLYKKQSR